MLIKFFWFFALGFWLNYLIAPKVLSFFAIHQMGRLNFRKKVVITGMGITLAASLFLSVALYYLVQAEPDPPLLLIFGCTIVSMTGLLDDIWGDHQHKGLKSHLRALLKGELTTGGIKAITGMAAAVIVAGNISVDYMNLIVNVLLLALFINTENLLDLRPGRAIKVFLLGVFIFLLAFPARNEVYWLVLVTGAAIAFLRIDFAEKAMLGDAGSNFLGFLLGYYAVVYLSLPFKLLFILLLTILHWYCERYSLTKLVARLRFLDYLDRLGRPEI